MVNKNIIFNLIFKKRILVFLAFISATFTGSFTLHAQQIQASLTPDSIKIGERAVLRVEVFAPEGSLVVPVALSDTIFNELEILSASPLDTLKGEGGEYSVWQEFVITSWKEGFYPIAPITIRIINRQDTLEVFSEPLLLEVYSVEIAEDATPYDIKPIFKIPVSFMDVFRWAGPLLLLLALIAGFAWWFVKKRKRRPVAESIWEKPDIPAHIAAISSLESLKNKKLWQNGKVKLYHVELTYIIRMFIEKRFGLLALEMTSGEIIQAIHSHFKEEDLTDSLAYIFELADLVKFAKFSPDPQQNGESMNLAIDFVKRNIPPPPAEEKKSKPQGQE
ncbi:MAG: hypothetical protein V2I46_05460 [Bacteroides sp.]|jgi:hypothetical protein|nr:hypothetical protein [Bacteroides sp.]